jgi:xanthine dehydrogenase large subunit
MAALRAARTIKDRIAAFLADEYQTVQANVVFANGQVHVGADAMTFAEAVKRAYLARVSLSATGFYATPKLSWDKDRMHGRPFYYFAYGAAVSEVIIDLLTGENRLVRADLLHDVGKSLNPAIDRGQIEGGFIQGVGWLTTEELVWNEDGRLTTHAPSTYKIPASADRPIDWRVAFYADGENSEETVHKSKAVGEPPLMLAISTWLALSDALAGISGDKIEGAAYPGLDAPATPERILLCANRLGARFV